MMESSTRTKRCVIETIFTATKLLFKLCNVRNKNIFKNAITQSSDVVDTLGPTLRVKIGAYIVPEYPLLAAGVPNETKVGFIWVTGCDVLTYTMEWMMMVGYS